MNKSLLGSVLGAIVATAITVGAIMYNPAPTPVADPEVVPVPSVVVVDPNQASVQIVAPMQVKVGELVVLDVSGSNAESFAWKVKPETKNFMVIDAGRRAVFSAESPGEYLFFVSAAKGGTVASEIHTIQVGQGSTPAKVDIAAKVPGWVEKVQTPTKRDDAIRLAQSFSSVASMVTPGMQPADIVAATVKSNRDALGSNIKAWEPFLIELQTELEARAADGSLKTADSHVVMWRSISQALTTHAQSTATPVAPTNTRLRGK